MNISTTVAAQGQADSPHNLAHFQCALQADAATVPAAKAKLKKQVSELLASLDAMKGKLGIDFVKGSLRTNSNVQQKYEWVKNKNEMRGYVASYSVSFSIDDLDKVSEVYDTLTDLDKVQVSHPTFSLKNKDRLNKKALKKAWDNVQARFEEECNVMGLDAGDFEVGTWEVTYSDSQRSDRVSKGVRAMAAGRVGSVRDELIESAAMGGGAEEDTLLSINPGNATVTVNLEIGYIRRANPSSTTAVRARVVANGHGVDSATV